MLLADERHTELAGLHTLLIGDLPAALTVVVLHGYGMTAAALSPFAHSLAMPGVAYAFPQGPLVAAGGHAWWRAERVEREPCEHHEARDLAATHPIGRRQARSRVRELLADLRDRGGGDIMLAGFSQGGMLAVDTCLLEPVNVDGLAMMSASCVALDEWRRRAERLRGMHGFVSHGRDDSDLAFSAGERLKNFLCESGASVTWVPFHGGHEIPISVWRQFRRFVGATLQISLAGDQKMMRYGTY